MKLHSGYVILSSHPYRRTKTPVPSSHEHGRLSPPPFLVISQHQDLHSRQNTTDTLTPLSKTQDSHPTSRHRWHRNKSIMSHPRSLCFRLSCMEAKVGTVFIEACTPPRTMERREVISDDPLAIHSNRTAQYPVKQRSLNALYGIATGQRHR